MQTHGIYLVQERMQNEIFLSKKLVRKTMSVSLRLIKSNNGYIPYNHNALYLIFQDLMDKDEYPK